MVKDIGGATGRQFSAEDSAADQPLIRGIIGSQARIVLYGLRGDDSIAEQCRK